MTVPADVANHTPEEIDLQLDVILRSSMHLINAAWVSSCPVTEAT